MTHTPTEEQAAIIEAARTTPDNLLISALAGAAKTSTLEMICHATKTIPILFLAFNKRIADEAAKRLPPNVEVRTLNALGHRVWSAVTGHRLSVDTKKMYTLLRGVIETLPNAQRGEAFGLMADTLDALRAAKRDGYVPPQWRGLARFHAGPLDEWAAGLDETPTSVQRTLIDQCLSASIEAAYAGGIDYDDQVYMPVVFGGTWPKFPLVMIDEAQDLSPLNHEMLASLVYRRVIAVGDPFQSIYGFRGAVANGMAALRKRFKMREMRLSVTFRVPQTGVRRAWSRVPHMRWRPDAPEGEITALPRWSAADVPDHSAIICRNNAPLFACSLRLLAAGRAIKLVGMDIGPGLLRTLRKLGPLEATAFEVLISEWQQSELKRARSAERVADKADCLRALCTGRKNLSEAIRWTEDLFRQNGPIQLLSGHKAKGLEWDTIFHLDGWRIPSRFVREGTEEWEQELNVRYVIETRFKERMFLVDLEGFQEEGR